MERNSPFLFCRSYMSGGSGFMISMRPGFGTATSGPTHAWARVRLLVWKWLFDIPRKGPATSMNAPSLLYHSPACGLGSGQQLQARLMLGPGLGFSFGSGCSTFLGKAPPRQWTPLVFYITHRHERVWVFLTFSYGRDGIRHLIIPFISPSPFNVSRIRPSIFLTSKVSLPKLLP